MEVKEIKGFRTISGQDVVTQINEKGDWLYPLQVVLVPNQGGGAGDHIGPLIPYAKNQVITPNPTSIFFSFEVDDKLGDQYKTAYSRMKAAESNLILPNQEAKKIII